MWRRILRPGLSSVGRTGYRWAILPKKSNTLAFGFILKSLVFSVSQGSRESPTTSSKQRLHGPGNWTGFWPPQISSITTGDWAEWTFSQLTLSMSKGKAFGQRGMMRRNYLGNSILVVGSQTKMFHPRLSSRAGIWYPYYQDHYMTSLGIWKKKNLLCVSVRKRFNVFTFLWCLFPLWILLLQPMMPLAGNFVMWSPHKKHFFGEITFLKLLQSCQFWKAGFIELIWKTTTPNWLKEKKTER